MGRIFLANKLRSAINASGPAGGVRGGEEMERRDVSLEQAVRNFCIRVLEGNGHPQEVAILPQMLQYVMGHDSEVESRQNELAAKVN